MNIDNAIKTSIGVAIYLTAAVALWSTVIQTQLTAWCNSGVPLASLASPTGIGGLLYGAAVITVLIGALYSMGKMRK